MEEGSSRAAAAAAAAVLPDEIILEILARLPFKTLCRCKCVSPAWRALISDPANRRRFAHTLSGLFFQRPYAYGCRPALAWDFVGLSMSSVSPPPPGVDTALSFLPPTCGEMELRDSCNGLLLLCCKGIHESPAPPPPPFYVVCNPATREWLALPQPSRLPGQVGYSTYAGPIMDTSTAALGFDPSVSAHFHVFQLVQVLDGYDFFVEEVEIYSSLTGRWGLSKINCSDRDHIRYTGQMTCFKGFLHMCIGNGVLSVDTEGQTWRMSRVRQDDGGWDRGSCVCHSQGRLLYVDTTVQSSSMSIYVLEDHDSEEWVWVFKQSINKQDLFGPLELRYLWDYYTVAFHPDCDLIFFYHWSQTARRRRGDGEATAQRAHSNRRRSIGREPGSLDASSEQDEGVRLRRRRGHLAPGTLLGSGDGTAAADWGQRSGRPSADWAWWAAMDR